MKDLRVVAAILCSHLVALVVLASGLVPQAAWIALEDASNGVVERRMVGALFVLLVALVVLALARVPARALGAGARRLIPGLAIAAVAWCIVQGILFAWFQGLGTTPHVAWTSFGELSFYAVAALSEELVFRGVLLLWLVDRFRRTTWHGHSAVIASLLLSSALFALAHLPVQLVLGASTFSSLIALVGHLEAGLLFGSLMLLGRNVWAATFVHLIVNARPGFQGSEALAPWFDLHLVVPIAVAAMWCRYLE